VAKISERLAVSKQTTNIFQMKKSIFKKLNEVEGEEEYRFEISNRVKNLENLDDDLDISRAWKTIRENIKISVKETRLL
jgi:hypothetical protein